MSQPTTDVEDVAARQHRGSATTMPRRSPVLRRAAAPRIDRLPGTCQRRRHLAKRLHTELVRATGKLADPTDLEFAEEHLDDPAALAAAVDDLLTRKPHLASRRPTGDIGQGASPSATRSVDLAALLRQRARIGGNMADLKELADQAAEELLKAIRDHAAKSR